MMKLQENPAYSISMREKNEQLISVVQVLGLGLDLHIDFQYVNVLCNYALEGSCSCIKRRMCEIVIAIFSSIFSGM